VAIDITLGKKAYKNKVPRSMTKGGSYMNARTGKKLRAAKVERKTYIYQWRAELDGAG
jgi:hypothetical protein